MLHSIILIFFFLFAEITPKMADMTPKPLERQPTGLLDGVPGQGPLDPPTQEPADEPPSYINSNSDAAPMPHRRPTMGERFHRLSSVAGKPLNKAAHVVGSEGWWPDTVNKECIKAARILYSFTSMSWLSL